MYSFLLKAFLPEIAENIISYSKLNFKEKYNLGITNKQTYDKYLKELIKLKELAYCLIKTSLTSYSKNFIQDLIKSTKIFDKYFAVIIKQTSIIENRGYIYYAFERYIVIYIDNNCEIIKYILYSNDPLCIQCYKADKKYNYLFIQKKKKDNNNYYCLLYDYKYIGIMHRESISIKMAIDNQIII